MPKTESYDAQSEYLKDIQRNAGPRNVPAHLMSKIRAASLNQLIPGQGDQTLGLTSGLSGSLLQWDGLNKLEKIGRIAELDHGEVRALLANEDDNEVLLVLLNRKKEIDAQRKG